MINPDIIKEDSPKVLQDGTGTPYLAIFSGAGNPIMDDQNNLPIGMLMSTFNYDYDEEDDDTGEFTLETDNPEVAACPELDYNSPLILQWGWIYPSELTYVGPQRNVIVVGKEVTFNESGTKIRIKFASSSILLKNETASYYDYSEGFLAMLGDLMDGNFIGTTLVDYRKNGIVYDLMEAHITDTDPESYDSDVSYHLAGNIFNPVYMIPQKPSVQYDDAVGFELGKWNFNSQYLCDNFSEEYFAQWVKKDTATATILRGVDVNKYQQMKTLVEPIKNGPYFIDGRDNSIIIHNAKVNRPISKTYTYAGGNWELLEFTVSSEYVRSSVSIYESGDINEDGELEVSYTQGDNAVQTKVVKNDSARYWGNRTWGLGDPIPTGKFSKPSPELTENEYRNIYGRDPDTQEIITPPQTQDPEKVVSGSSLEEVTNELLNNRLETTLTPEEVDQYWQEFSERYKAAMGELDGVSDESLADYLHYGLRMGNLRVTRKAHITQTINASVFASMGSLSAEEYYEGLRTGKYDLLSYDAYAKKDPSKPTTTNTGTSFSENGLKGYEYLQQMNGVSVEVVSQPTGEVYEYNAGGQGQYLNSADLVRVSYDADVEVPIPGIRIIQRYMPSAIGAFPGMLEDHLNHQMEARATIVGDPCMESSMNLLIQNVSSKYSGVWYIKKISHRMSASAGYKCEIEFVQRTSDTIISSAQTKNKLLDMYKEIQQRAEKLDENPDQQWTDFIETARENKMFSELNENKTAVEIDASQGPNIVSVNAYENMSEPVVFQNDENGDPTFNVYGESWWAKNSEGSQNQAKR